MRVRLFFVFIYVCLISCSSDDGFLVPLGDKRIDIFSPEDGYSLKIDELVTLRGQLTFNDSINIETLRVRWISDKDGLLFEGNLNDQGQTNFSTPNLSRDVHTITLEIENQNGEILLDTIQIFNKIFLFPVDNESSKSIISWSSIEANNFIGYDLYRSESVDALGINDPIYSTTNFQDTTFIDQTAPIGKLNYYKVVARNSTYPEIKSNVEFNETGIFSKLNFPIKDLVVNHNTKKVYAIINTPSRFSENSTGYGIIEIDFDNFRVLRRVANNIRFNDIALDPTGTILFATASQLLSNNLYRFDLNNNMSFSTSTLSQIGNQLVVGNSGMLYYHINGGSGTSTMRMYDYYSNTRIPYASSSPSGQTNFGFGEFVVDDNNNIYHGGSNSSGSRISKIGTSNNAFALLNQWNSNNYQQSGITLRDNRIFWNHYYMDLNFNRLGTFVGPNGFDDFIFDANSDGVLSVGNSGIYSSVDQNLISSIPANYDLAEFVEDDSLILVKVENPLFQDYLTTLIKYDLE